MEDVGGEQGPVTEPIENACFEELARAVRHGISDIIREWESEVGRILPKAHTLTFVQLRNHIPQALERLADAFGSTHQSVTRDLLTESIDHGVSRLDQGYEVYELLIEYQILRHVAIGQIEKTMNRRMTQAEDIAFSTGLDSILHQGVVTFVKQLQVQLRSAVEAEAKFLSFISHDLRNQLNNTMYRLHFATRDLKKNPAFSEVAAVVATTQQRMAETVAGMERVLQAERIRRHPEPRCEEIGLREFTLNLTEPFRLEAEMKGLQIVVDVSPDLVLHSDREWLAPVLQNLISNAVKYSGEGAVVVSASRRQEGNGSVCELAVSDQGPGIAPEMRKRIFEAFRRGTTHGKEGIGLGLAIAFQAAQLLGADLTLDSEPGRGSTFRLVFRDRPNSNAA
jgi:signal transduction histidine kinase